MPPYTPPPSSSTHSPKNSERERENMMMMMMTTNDGSSSEVDLREVEEEEELELGLSLGANIRKYSCGRILTAKDLLPPSALGGSRDSPMSSSSSSSSSGIKRAPPSSQVVVGWPPIRAFRMNSLVTHSKDNASDTDTGNPAAKSNDDAVKNHEMMMKKKKKRVVASRFVKVNMDGDPIGRKVDLGAHASYQALALALELMFRKPHVAVKSSPHCTQASKLLLDGSSEFALTYEDKEGDWMLLGDVPWGMFLDTVKRLRIMRTSDAGGLPPRFQPSTGVK